MYGSLLVYVYYIFCIVYENIIVKRMHIFFLGHAYVFTVLILGGRHVTHCGRQESMRIVLLPKFMQIG